MEEKRFCGGEKSMDLNEEYNKRLTYYEEASARSKRQFYTIWFVIFFLTWASFLMAILCTDIKHVVGISFLRWTIVLSSFVTFVLTLLQILGGFRKSWIVCRAGAQMLIDFAIKYRAGLAPYNDKNAEEFAAKEMENIDAVIKKLQAKPGIQILWQIIQGVPEELKEEFTDIKRNDLKTRLTYEEYCKGRIQSQQKWFLTKAQKYARYFLGFQLVILAAMLFSLAWNTWVGYTVRVTAATSTIILCMIAFRDFLDCRSLALRYFAAANRLKALLKHTQEDRNLGVDIQRCFPNLIQGVEATLRSEFQYWYAAAGGPLKLQGDAIFQPCNLREERIETYQPSPMDTRKIRIPESLHPAIEILARHNHDVWAQGRIKEGWSYAPTRDDVLKKHPDLVPYEELSESEKDYDRRSAEATLMAILSMGYKVEKG